MTAIPARATSFGTKWTALLVPPGDVAGLTLALDRLMSDAELRQRFAERAVEAKERFSMGRIAGMWEELFEKVVE